MEVAHRFIFGCNNLIYEREALEVRDYLNKPVLDLELKRIGVCGVFCEM